MAKTEEPKKEQISVPTQKTFIFNEHNNNRGYWLENEIDEVVNEWLIGMAKKGTIPMLGKITASLGTLVVVYMYATKIDK